MNKKEAIRLTSDLDPFVIDFFKDKPDDLTYEIFLDMIVEEAITNEIKRYMSLDIEERKNNGLSVFFQRQAKNSILKDYLIEKGFTVYTENNGINLAFTWT